MTGRRLGPRDLTEDELAAWGKEIGARIVPPLWISLYGPLGAGKSVLCRAVCRGAGVTGPIPSPTFTLVQAYESPRGFAIHHVDLFRLEPGDPLEPLGWDELLRSSGLVLVEWADRAADQQPGDRWGIRLDHAAAGETRQVEVERLGSAPDLIGW